MSVQMLVASYFFPVREGLQKCISEKKKQKGRKWEKERKKEKGVQMLLVYL